MNTYVLDIQAAAAAPPSTSLSPRRKVSSRPRAARSASWRTAAPEGVPYAAGLAHFGIAAARSRLPRGFNPNPLQDKASGRGRGSVLRAATSRKQRRLRHGRGLWSIQDLPCREVQLPPSSHPRTSCTSLGALWAPPVERSLSVRAEPAGQALRTL